MIERAARKPLLTTSVRFQICKLALSMGKSERKFYEEFDEWERAQMLATYQAEIEMANIQQRYPAKPTT
jgi:hypothetical protein